MGGEQKPLRQAFFIMNKAAKLVTSLIAGTRGTNVLIGGKVYFITSPTLRTLCRVLSEFSEIDIDYTKAIGAELRRVPDAVRYVSRGLAIAIKPKADDKGIDKLTDDIMDGSLEELAAALGTFIQMASLGEVFTLAASATRYAEAAAKERR